MTAKAAAELAAIRAYFVGRPHRIVPIEVDRDGWRTWGRCLLCGRPIVETGDWRGRWRHQRPR